MKKAAIVFILTLLSIPYLKGQGIEVGLVGGGNLSTLNLENASYRPGYQVGGFAELMVTRRMGLQTEILYSVQQSSVQGQLLSLEYALIPVLAKIKLNKFVNIQLGPQYSMFLSSMGEGEAFEDQSYKTRNVSFALGVGVDLPMGFSTSLRFANAIDKSFSNIGEVTSDVVQLSIAINLLKLSQRN